MSPSLLLPRQGVYNDGYDGGWWYGSETAFIIKWVITGVIVIGLLIFFVGGYFHAQRRLKKNMAPLRYHKWMVSRRQRAQYPHLFPVNRIVQYHNTPYGYGQAMPLNTYAPPPPAYGEHDYVPPYAPPQGGSKVNPDQSYQAHDHSGPSQSSGTAGQYR